MSPARRGSVAPFAMVFIAVLVSAVAATFVFGKDYRSVRGNDAYFHRHAFVPSFDPITDALVGYAPSAMATNPGIPSAKVRAITLYPRKIVLLAGGMPVRTIALRRPVTTLKALAQKLGDAKWLAIDGTTITAKTAIIAQPGSHLRIAAPETKTLVLRSTPGVFLGAVTAQLAIAGVTVRGTSSAPPEISTTTRMDLGRPFIVAYSHSTMTISHSKLLDLGRDWNASYGASWSLGSTGSVTDSTFERNFIGIYTDHAHDLLVKHNVFRDNTLYGVDPHSFSVRMDIEDNLSERNGRHGIIFSDHVTDGIVRNNVTRGNDLNGIMMDASSTGNRIVGNLSEDNHGDGIVLASSPGNVITGNRILRNRIGIQARGPRDSTTLANNELSGNSLASQGVSLAGNDVHGNGGQWKPKVVQGIWIAAGPLLLLFFVLTAIEIWRRDRRVPAPRRTVTA
jgi:poly(beta-D-mannuronate) C5 epimerase